MIEVLWYRTVSVAILIIVASGCSGGSPSQNSAPEQGSPKVSEPSLDRSSMERPLGPPLDLSRKLMAKQLTGARLESNADEGEWSFTEIQFVLQAGKQPLPFNLQLVLLGPGRSASRVEGKWRLEDAMHPKGEYEGVIVLWDIRGDEKEGLKETKLDFQSVGPVEFSPDGVSLGRNHVKIGGLHEYKIIPGKS
jgi:hypothetical protein